jgi:hypothetical protein
LNKLPFGGTTGSVLEGRTLDWQDFFFTLHTQFPVRANAIGTFIHVLRVRDHESLCIGLVWKMREKKNQKMKFSGIYEDWAVYPAISGKNLS